MSVSRPSAMVPRRRELFSLMSSTASREGDGSLVDMGNQRWSKVTVGGAADPPEERVHITGGTAASRSVMVLCGCSRCLEIMWNQ